MRNTTLIVLLFLVFISPFTNLHAQTPITSCDTVFMDSGNYSNYINNAQDEWLICPDAPSLYLTLTFTHVDIEAANNNGKDSTGCYDLLYIYDGTDVSAPLIGSFCGEASGSGKNSFIEGHTLKIGDSFKPKNNDGCFYIRFESDASKNLSGWIAEVSCCAPSLDNGITDGIDVPIASNNGNYINLIIDNSCTRGGTLDLFTEFEPSGESCFSKGLTLENQAFYAFESNPSGGFVELAIDSIDSVGVIEMVVFGPVTLDTLGNYKGGLIKNCVTGDDPESLFFNAGPNQTYILGVATEIPGSTSLETIPSTVGLGGVLPVKMVEYRLSTNDRTAELLWTTSNQINNDRFEIFRSLDGKEFINIGVVKGVNNSNMETYYGFKDTPDTTGEIYYYLRQIDLDGSHIDFAILKATFSKPAITFNTFPNPSIGGRFSLNIEKEILDSDAQMQIFDQIGNLVVNKKIDGVASFDFQELISGVYTIKIIAGSTVITNQHIIY